MAAAPDDRAASHAPALIDAQTRLHGAFLTVAKRRCGIIVCAEERAKIAGRACLPLDPFLLSHWLTVVLVSDPRLLNCPNGDRRYEGCKELRAGTLFLLDRRARIDLLAVERIGHVF